MSDGSETPPPEPPRPRILHCVDAGDDAGEPPHFTLDLMRRWVATRTRGGPQAVLLIGGEGLARAADTAGLVSHRRLAFPLRQPLLAPTAGRNAFRGLTAADLVHTWSIGALNAATLFRPRTPRVHHVTTWPDGADARRLVRLMNSGGFDVRCASEGLRAHLVDIGLPAGRVRFDAPAPLFDPAPVDGPSPSVAEPLILAAVADPLPAADAVDLVLAAVLAGETTHREVRVRLHPAARRLPEARRLLRQVGREHLLHLDHRLASPANTVEKIHGFILAGPPAPLPVLHVAQTGLPVIAPRTPEFEALLAPLPAARVYLSRSPSSRHLGHQIVRLLKAEPGNAATDLAAPAASPAPGG